VKIMLLAVLLGSGSALAAQSTLTIDADAAIITIFVKPDKVTAFDQILETLKAALQRSKNPLRNAQAAGWQVFKTEEQVQGNITYVMRLDPVVRNIDYDITRIFSEELPGEAVELSRAYREAQVARALTTMTRITVPGLGEPSPAQASPVTAPAIVPVLSFETAQAVVMTVLIRPEREAAFEMTLAQLGKALQASTTPGRKRQAAGWKVYRGMQPFNGNIAYVVSLDPVVHRAEYDPMRLIQETYPDSVDALFQKYREAYVGQAISRLTNRIEMTR
jgi:hypothetical protein